MPRNLAIPTETLVKHARAAYPQLLAVVLVGSAARGNDHDLSDIDILCLGENLPGYELGVLEGRLIALQGKAEEAVRRDFANPILCAQAVPSWRDSRILHDPDYRATALHQEAIDWNWNVVDAELASTVTREVIGYAEEALKLIAAARSGHLTAAAVQANLIAIHLTPVIAAATRRFVPSENALWDGSAGDPEWFAGLAEIQDADPRQAASAALTLYLKALDVASPGMTTSQQAVADLVQQHAKKLIR
ncbi:nucleotidyltransferase domain-containing protein [Demetria terragena]|uniref:nucleotidyltransferase domain-containing protein n=1 Tax=Demetria terragena TaxID=63959 RepID=UPI000370ADDA|nr:nucleotidyltransferase domain-containing protein [Demetria terragena]